MARKGINMKKIANVKPTGQEEVEEIKKVLNKAGITWTLDIWGDHFAQVILSWHTSKMEELVDSLRKPEESLDIREVNLSQLHGYNQALDDLLSSLRKGEG